MHWTYEQLTSLIAYAFPVFKCFGIQAHHLCCFYIFLLDIFFKLLHYVYTTSMLTICFFQIMGYKIFVHEIHSDYAARIDNFRGYDTVSKDIIHRWTYPLVPDVMNFGDTATKLERQGIYRASGMDENFVVYIGNAGELFSIT